MDGRVPGLFFLIGGSRFFLNGGRETVVDSSLAEVVALVDDSASSAATTSTFSSGSSGDKASSLGRFRSRALVGGGLRSTGVEAPSSLSTWAFALGVALRFGLVSARGGDGS